jgi:hypothetical protein
MLYNVKCLILANVAQYKTCVRYRTSVWNARNFVLGKIYWWMVFPNRLISYEVSDRIISDIVRHILRFEDGSIRYHQNMDVYISNMAVL